jgi:hypothetical protein
MWTTTVRVRRDKVLAADVEPAAAFLRTPAPWALLPRTRHAFAAADSPPGAGQLICLVGRPDQAGSVMEVTADPSGRLIQGRSRTSRPALDLQLAVSVEPRGAGLRLGVEGRGTCGRAEKLAAEDALRTFLGRWLRALADSVEGRVAWPAREMPAELLAEWLAWPASAEHEPLEVEGVVLADVPTTWQAARSPVTQRTRQPPVCTGYVPGTPPGQVGEMIYQVLRRPDDRLLAAISLVTEIADEQFVRTIRVGRPWAETLTSLQTVSDGTKITLTGKAPGAGPAARDQLAAGLRARLDVYQGLLGTPA